MTTLEICYFFSYADVEQRATREKIYMQHSHDMSPRFRPAQKRSTLVVLMSESQQSTSTAQEDFTPPYISEHQHGSTGKKSLKHAKQI